MKKSANTIAIIGDGGWGTTLAIHLAKKHYQVNLWGPFPEYVEQVRKNRYNPKFLPGIRIPEQVAFFTDIKEAVEPSFMAVFAVPSQYAASVLKKMKECRIPMDKRIFLSVTKGFDYGRLLTISQLIRKEYPKAPVAVLSGPTIASEVAKGVPSTAVVASHRPAVAKKAQAVFNSEAFRIYTNSDVMGVELGGSLKNIIAIACGVCDGLGYGSNTKSAIITRGLAEMTRLGKAMGAKARTFSGLSGLGDLATTCISPQSRNRTVGESIGRGKGVKDILNSMDMVAEGVETARAVKKLAEKYRVDMPICLEVYHILYSRKKPRQAVADLMSRKAKPE